MTTETATQHLILLLAFCAVTLFGFLCARAFYYTGIESVHINAGPFVECTSSGLQREMLVDCHVPTFTFQPSTEEAP